MDEQDPGPPWLRGAAHILLSLQPAWDLDISAVPHDRGTKQAKPSCSYILPCLGTVHLTPLHATELLQPYIHSGTAR